MTTPLEQLQEYVRPGGPAETLCPSTMHKLRPDVPPLPKGKIPFGDVIGDCDFCHGTGVIVSPQVLAIREALWKVRQPTLENHPTVWTQRRSREQAALLLPDAAATIYASVHLDYIGEEWLATVAGRMGHNQDWLDALCAAVEAALVAQEEKP